MLPTAKTQHYRLLAKQARALFSAEQDWLANCANFTALLYHNMENVNWLGFYFRHGDELVLGPFQGQVACVRIPLGQGVCGQAALQQQPLRVDDVQAFAGHIACDSTSQSELVLPVIAANCLLGVLDVDSPRIANFNHDDEVGLQQCLDILLQSAQIPLP